MLLTRPPLSFKEASFLSTPLDLHVLGTPPAFVLSQDQTLHKVFELAHFVAGENIAVLYVLKNQSSSLTRCSVFKDQTLSLLSPYLSVTTFISYHLLNHSVNIFF